MYCKWPSRSNPSNGASCGRLLQNNTIHDTMRKIVTINGGSLSHCCHLTRSACCVKFFDPTADAIGMVESRNPNERRPARIAMITNPRQLRCNDSAMRSGPNNGLPGRTIGPSYANAAFCQTAPRHDACQVESQAIFVPPH